MSWKMRLSLWKQLGKEEFLDPAGLWLPLRFGMPEHPQRIFFFTVYRLILTLSSNVNRGVNRRTYWKPITCMLGFCITLPNEVLHHFLDSQLSADVHKHLCTGWNSSQSRESNRCLSCLYRSIRHAATKTHCGINSAFNLTAVTWLQPLSTFTLVGGQDNQRFLIYLFI